MLERYAMLQIGDEYIDKLIELFENIRDNQFEIGDMLVLLVDSIPGQRQEVMNYIAGVLAVAPSTLYDYENTSRRWTPDKRLEYAAMDYTIYRNSDPVRDKELLDQAIDENWNASTFKEHMFPALVEPSNQIMRIIRILQKILKETIPPSIETEIKSILDKLTELHSELDDTFK